MRLAIVLSSMSHGGAQRVTALLANEWVRRGEAVCLITLDAADADCYELDERVQRVPLEVSGDSRHLADAVAGNWRRIAALRRALRTFRAEVVLGFGDQTNVLAVLATIGSGMRCVVGEVTDPARHSIGTVWDVLRRLTYPLATALVVQTRALLPWARSVMLGSRRAFAVRNPVRDMRPYQRERSAGGDYSIVAVGRLAPEKALDVLLAAFSRLASRFPRWKVVLVGEGPERAALAELARSLGIAERVIFAGWLPEPGQELAKADLFVMSSRYEGFPNALLEAMACGLPVISTDCLGSREIITPDVDGLLVPIDSVSGLERAMAELMGDAKRRVRLASAALAVTQRFSLEAVVAEWDAILVDRPAPLEACRA